MHYIECILIQIGFEICIEGNMMHIQIGSNRNQIETSKMKTLNRSRIVYVSKNRRHSHDDHIERRNLFHVEPC